MSRAEMHIGFPITPLHRSSFREVRLGTACSIFLSSSIVPFSFTIDIISNVFINSCWNHRHNVQETIT